jgi:hypothetical protein
MGEGVSYKLASEGCLGSGSGLCSRRWLSSAGDGNWSACFPFRQQAFQPTPWRERHFAGFEAALELGGEEGDCSGQLLARSNDDCCRDEIEDSSIPGSRVLHYEMFFERRIHNVFLAIKVDGDVFVAKGRE